MRRYRWIRAGLIAAALCFAATGCSAASDEQARIAAAAASPQTKAEAEQTFSKLCARCHGPLGKGDGPDAHKLTPRPRNFSDPTWHLAVSDQALDRVIVEGGAAVGKSSLMPAHPDLAKRPALLLALRQHLRALAIMP